MPENSPAKGEAPPVQVALAALLFVAAFVAFLPALRGGFIFDDDVTLTSNPLIQGAGGLGRIWFSRDAADYWPLSASSLWIEWRLWGQHALGYHATNLVLHGVCVILLWFALKALKVPGAFLGALLFAVHPMNAEAVAWIAQRKTLLAVLFSFGSVLAFVRGGRWWAVSLGAFVLGLLSKGSAVFLPLVLLGIVLWERRPTRSDLFRLAPFFVVAMGLAGWEASFSTVGASLEPRSIGLLARLLRAGAEVWFYLGRIACPAGLSFDYGPWSVHPANLRAWLPLLAALATSILFWRYRTTWSRPALFAWAYFCAALAPALGFVSVGFMRYSPVSNHYATFAVAGAAAFAGSLWARGLARAGRPARQLLTGGAAAVVILFAIGAWKQSFVYAEAPRLYETTIARNPSSWLARTNLAVLLQDDGKLDEAQGLLEAAVHLNPSFAIAWNNLGVVCDRKGDLLQAEAGYREALSLDPDYAEAHNNLGTVFGRQGKVPEAIAEFEKALAIEPDHPGAKNNLAHARSLEGR